MSLKRKKHGREFKARVALEAARNDRTLNEIGHEYGLHPIQVGKWRKELIERAPELFTDGRKRGDDERSAERKLEELYEQIGRLKVENDFLKKKSGLER